MDIRELAADYAAMVAAGDMGGAAQKYWSPEIATYEAMSSPGMPGEFDETHGVEEAMKKVQWWEENNEVHGLQSDGPYVHGDTFLIRMSIDVTPKGGTRMQMSEVVAYRVADGKVVEERYFY